MEQIKGPNDVRLKILTAANEARKSKDYPIELRIGGECHYISDKYHHDHHTNKILVPTHGTTYPSLDRKYENNTFIYQ